MLIRCPKCSTGFNLPDDKIPEKGAKVRCSACTHTFRVRIEDGEPVFFYKKGKESPPAGTAVGSPGMLEAAGLAEDSEKTQFGIPQRQRTTSKSAAEGYNPFPLAGRATAVGDDETAVADANDRTQLLGGGATTPVEDIPLGDFAGPNDRTQLGASGLAEESMGDRTQLGAPVSVAEDDEAEADGARTRALGSGGLDLFDGAAPREREAAVVDVGVDFDPFEDAFDEPVGDVGLLMPSVPSVMEEPSHPDSSPLPPAMPDSVDSEPGMTEDDFLLGGGGGSDFGDALSLVDNSFGEDVASFDPNAGVVSAPTPAKTKRGSRSKSQAPLIDLDEEIELGERPTRKAPAPRQPQALAPEPAPKPAAARRPVPAYAQNNVIGATSPVRRTFDLIFIVLVVAISFVGLVTARAGGFVDFTRFGHMIEVAFSGADFVPREEWRQVVEVQPPDPPPDEPLRIENVRALEREVSGQHVLLVSGRVRNYSLKEFKSVQIRLSVVDGHKTKVSEKLQTVGQSFDRKKIAAAKTIADLQASITKKSPDLGKEGVTHFAVVFDDVPSKLVKSGRYDYSVVVAD